MTKKNSEKAEAMPPKEDDKKTAVLQPRKMKNGRWRVSLGIIIENGRRKNPRLQFKTRADAKLFCDAERQRKRAHGEITANADGVKVAQWMKLDAAMESSGASLADVGEWVSLNASLREAGAPSLKEVGMRMLKDVLSVQKKGTVAECRDAWLESLKGKRGRYRGNGRKISRNFIHGTITDEDEDGAGEEKANERWNGVGPDRRMLEIGPEIIKSWRDHHPGYFAVLSAWFGWATKAGWLPKNPCAGLKPEVAKPTEVICCSTEEAGLLLKRAAINEDWSVLSYLVLSLFAGIRPEEFRKVAKGEPIRSLTWENCESEFISIPPELSKTKAGRIIEVTTEPVLHEWLNFIRKGLGGNPAGPIIPANWKKVWGGWRKKHWAQPWTQDLLRHTFGSHHLARSQSLELTSRVMGTSPDVLDKHYWNWRTRSKHATVYWDLLPARVLENEAIPPSGKPPASAPRRPKHKKHL